MLAGIPRSLVGHYPRGSKPLRGPFSQFACGDSIAWFDEHGLTLVEESDGRMFPEQNRSEAVVECLRRAALAAGVKIHCGSAVRQLSCSEAGGFQLSDQRSVLHHAKRVLLASGGHPSGRRLAQDLGHTIVPPVPSLFSLRLQAPALTACSGIALDDVSLDLKVGEQRFRQTGRVLITHRGVSGPAVLRLTAFAARALHANRYQGELRVDWSGGLGRERVQQKLQQARLEQARRTVVAAKPFEHLPTASLACLFGAGGSGCRAALGGSSSEGGTTFWWRCVCAQRLLIQGRGPFGEEFVTAGGVALGEVNLATMESRRCAGLYLAGELLDVDGVTGGFNFQACWSGGWLGGRGDSNFFSY